MILASVVLPLEAKEWPTPKAARDWLYSLLGKHPEKDAFGLAVLGKSRPAIRISILDEKLYGDLSRRFWSLIRARIEIGGSPAKVLAVVEEGHPWAKVTTLPRLFQGKATADFGFQLLSPTLFRKNGLLYLVPEPALFFSSLKERLTQISKISPPAWLDETFSRLTLRHANLETRAPNWRPEAKGLVGVLTFHLPRANQEELRWLRALHQLAYFTGLGEETDIGYGLTRPYIPNTNLGRP